MSIIGTVESVWRYPVKSMRGEQLEEIFVTTAGVRGDRLFAIRSSAAPAEFPYFTARQQHEMLRYRPCFRDSDGTGHGGIIVEVETPSGERLRVDDPALIEQIRRGIDDKHQVSLMRSDRPLTDARPISIFSLQTARKLGQETGTTWDRRRFRANIYLDLPGTRGFAEDDLVGREVRIGREVILSVVKKDGRCVIVNLDPDTAAAAPALLRQVAQAHDGKAGVYCDVASEGIVRSGDAVQLLPEAN
ncbi:MAG: MOSC domain-containing protein [Verrucomicrobiota bacterium]|nr:MOSC domain-containing protein [Verrucomicrobiota bacterium]